MSFPNKFSYTRARKPIIFGVCGHSITSDEVAFFKKHRPLGFILFARNIHDEAQVRALTESLQDVLCEEQIPILIDVEGGMVNRVQNMENAPKMPAINEHHANSDMCKDHYGAMSKYLVSLGITVNCAPVLDLQTPYTYEAMRSRCFSSDPNIVTNLGAQAICAMQENGCTPVIKHIPGYGLARKDAHFDLPVIDQSLEELSYHFEPFKKNAGLGAWAMSSHPVYLAIDPCSPATYSHKLVREIVRGEIGFDGFLLTDDLYMHALTESLEDRVTRSLDALHDAALLCHPDIYDMEFLDEIGDMSNVSTERFLIS